LSRDTKDNGTFAKEIYRGPALKATDTTINGDITYYYKLKACNKTGCSDFSKAIQVVVGKQKGLGNTEQPEILVLADNSSVVVAWSRVAKAKRYELYRDKTSGSSSGSKIYTNTECDKLSRKW